MNESESWIFTGVKVKRLHAELVAGFHATTEEKTCKAQKDMDSWVSFLATMFRGGKNLKRVSADAKGGFRMFEVAAIFSTQHLDHPSGKRLEEIKSSNMLCKYFGET